ncbi:NADH:ubiquinone reductase (Na(+)-transporting) subunit E [Candidatus Riflebacteria bacterium]
MDLVEYLGLAVNSIFIGNILLAYFLGMCSFLACSKRLDTAIGLGCAVIFVLTITTPTNWLLHEYLLKKGAMAWAGYPQLDLSFLNFITFIAVIAFMVQVVEIIIEKFSPRLYAALGIFLPLIAVNCAILGCSLFMVERNYGFIESTVYGFSSGIGWFLAITGIAAIRNKLRYSKVPEGLKGLGITMIVTGLMSMAFLGFSGIEF